MLEAEPNVDQILCLGDLVNYGPQSAECVAWAKSVSANLPASPLAIMVQGNHDHALGCNASPRCSAAYAEIAAAVQRVTAQRLTSESKKFLANLEPIQQFQIDGASCFACHASPRDPLYRYLPPTTAEALWKPELHAAREPDFLFFGHTHLPDSVENH